MMDNYSKSQLLGDIAELLYKDATVYKLTECEIYNGILHLIDKYVNSKNNEVEVF